MSFHQPHLFPSRIGCYSRHRVLFTASGAIHGIECSRSHVAASSLLTGKQSSIEALATIE